ncbi:S-adenosylmethionine-diacylglycerol 3-amino-3-carboxypropyl transferase [Loktanella fryxellensis]|uniref:S-adenosylmethionine-diacylglycerol 3-amino-3-carboxypropyl transferase n=1 Tax=Loktanella fryxellensis TaxID=245187 RepID=A0A1H8JBW4_9RHOB|nr:DUF3419 family protein [Loktanella fryxellensis]SEN77895.1 S-adenosylmethionine-diacylglycerol 3-amino-3-carboxypropyl transferase [Loktanella fryxellensis]
MTRTPDVADQMGASVHRARTRDLTGVLERLFARLFTGLVYPQIWEDPVADMSALHLAPGADMFCIASGGCNVMSYLTLRPGTITAVDLSPAHVALGRLKIAAAQHLTQGQFLAFFGHADRAANVDIYDRVLAGRLDPRTRAFWDARVIGRRRISMFARGFYRFGVLGRFLSLLHFASRVGGLNYAPLLAAPDMDAQRRFFDTRIAPLLDSAPVRWMAQRRVSLFGLGIPPAQYDKLARDGGGDVLPVLKERVRKLSCDFPIAENYFAWQAFGRRYAPDATASLPPYLQPQHFDAIATGAARVTVLNRAMTDVLQDRDAASLDAFVLLDAQDWMDDGQLNALWDQITRTARPGARVIFRTGGADDILPGRVAPAVLGRWQRDAAASATGFAEDRAAIYGGFHLYRLER